MEWFTVEECWRAHHGQLVALRPEGEAGAAYSLV